MIIQILTVLTKIAFAIIFGALFWWFLESFQPDIVNYKFSCCERCGNILFEREQPILAFCAGLAFLVSAFLKVKGWKVILVTIGISFLCFYPYWLFTYWTAHSHQECTALNYPRRGLPFFNEFTMFIISGFWASLCAAALLIVQGISLIFNSKKVSETTNRLKESEEL